jgi:hypothetical protein
VLAPACGNLDVGVQKPMALARRARVEVRIAFTPNFGRIFSAQPARQMQPA